MPSLILSADSYKHSHYRQYPPNINYISGYIEARSNSFSDKVLFFGLQTFLKQYGSQKLTMEDVNEAAGISAKHGVPFNRSGWEIIVDELGGYLPLEIRALEEGRVVPCSIPLLQVVNTDPRFPWLTMFVETALLRAIWYPSSVATLSWKAKKMFLSALMHTSDQPEDHIDTRLHDFGARGVSSGESAGLGGMAHLINFIGTDTMEGLCAAMEYYNATPVPGISIPAAEHSTITAWGRDRELDAYSHILDEYSGTGKVLAIVSDSYDLELAVRDIWGDSLRSKVLAAGGTLVVRPDSGDPVETPIKVISTLYDKFGGSINSKGYRVLNPAVRVLQGDGMSITAIASLLTRLGEEGWSAENIACGMGGGLLQNVNRDTLNFAMKANAVCEATGEWRDAQKKPAEDLSKSSKAGRQKVTFDGQTYKTQRIDAGSEDQGDLKTVFRNGEILKSERFEDIRERARSALEADLNNSEF
ncbi:MAG: nicotinate phosphoribosyltransferase [Pseudomonadota bacterium]